jgi:hypothetical protein
MNRLRFDRSAPVGAHAAHRVGRVLTVVVAIGLALVLIGSLVFGAVVVAGTAPDFDQRIALDARHLLVIHNGPSPTCAVIPNPPQHDCYRPGLERREFSVDYLTPNRVWSLLWFRLPEP